MRIGGRNRWCDHPACYSKQAMGVIKLQSYDVLLGKTRVKIHLCPKHYNEMLEFISAYVGMKKEV